MNDRARRVRRAALFHVDGQRRGNACGAGAGRASASRVLTRSCALMTASARRQRREQRRRARVRGRLRPRERARRWGRSTRATPTCRWRPRCAPSPTPTNAVSRRPTRSSTPRCSTTRCAPRRPRMWPTPWPARSGRRRAPRSRRPSPAARRPGSVPSWARRRPPSSRLVTRADRNGPGARAARPPRSTPRTRSRPRITADVAAVSGPAVTGQHRSVLAARAQRSRPSTRSAPTRRLLWPSACSSRTRASRARPCRSTAGPPRAASRRTPTSSMTTTRR